MAPPGAAAAAAAAAAAGTGGGRAALGKALVLQADREGWAQRESAWVRLLTHPFLSATRRAAYARAASMQDPTCIIYRVSLPFLPNYV